MSGVKNSRASLCASSKSAPLAELTDRLRKFCAGWL